MSVQPTRTPEQQAADDARELPHGDPVEDEPDPTGNTGTISGTTDYVHRKAPHDAT